jgi:hypothetical protein
MASILTQAADAVCSELNTKLAGWGYATTQAVRKNKTTFVLEECEDLRVTVLPIACPVETAARGLLKWAPTVDVDVRKRTADDVATEDAMVELIESVAAHFLGEREPTDFKCISVEPSVVVPGEDLTDKGLFAVAVRLTLQAHSSGESA